MVGVGVLVTLIKTGSSPKQMVCEVERECDPVKVFTLMVSVVVAVQPVPSEFSATVTEKVSPSEKPVWVVVVLAENTPRGVPL
jgi:predicted aconitase with swiveling domain